MGQIKWLTGILLPALFIAMLLQACENDLNKVKQISALEVSKPIDTTKGVDIVYSDSAKVRARVVTPLMIHFTKATNPHYEMPKGVKIFFYDDKLNQKTKVYDPEKHVVATVVSDYAITSNNEKLIELRKNVVVRNTQGDVFTTQQLFYDVNKKLIYSNQYCQMTKVDGTALDGTAFTSNESFTETHFEHGKGVIATKGNMLQ
jgi:LPS export ABC transporter protein LptC